MLIKDINIKLYKALIIVVVSIMCQVCSAQHLNKAFNSISKINGFQKIPYTAEEYGYPKEMGTMKMICCGNSKHRDKVLQILDLVPNDLMKINFVDDRDKITRIYIETNKENTPFFMQIFIGLSGNDLCAWLFTGASLDYYIKFAEQINNKSCNE